MRRVLKVVLGVIIFFVVAFVGLLLYVQAVATIEIPEIQNKDILSSNRVEKDTLFYTIGNNWFRKSESGLYEVYVEGDPFERGVVLGKLTEELVKKQEVIFNKQIEQLVPSSTYRKFLTYFIGWFNRDLDNHVPEEYKLEILGVSQSATHDYDHVAPPYQRILNYHAAHDIGHALQNMALVGCTSFGVWNSASSDSTLLIGRNFDFFVGEEFAKDKIVAFYKPTAGYNFMMITWGGMTGVLSGMNDQGLTVTLNAAKSEIPTGSATPVSLVAREILQYATTIDEAMAIAQKRKTFVAESFLIGSAKDNRTSIIEKTPDETTLVETESNWIIDTNHFQSQALGSAELNREHIKTSASQYRYNRVKELLEKEKVSVESAIAILRNKEGMNDTQIGLGNEKAINQLVAHHSIVFQPQKKIAWVSTAPWQLGKYVAYDLTKIFAEPKNDNSEVYEQSLVIPADDFITEEALTKYLKYFQYRFPFQSRGDIEPDSVVHWNPELYHAYMLAGDELCVREEYQKAMDFFEKALTKEIATEQERTYIKERIEYCKNRLE